MVTFRFLIKFHYVNNAIKFVKHVQVLLVIAVLNALKDFIDNQKTTLAKILVQVVDSLKMTKLENVYFAVKTVKSVKVLNLAKYVRTTT